METLRDKLLMVIAGELPEDETTMKLIEDGLVTRILDKVMDTIIEYIDLR